MIELSVLRDLVAIFGVIAGFSYYVLTVQNNRKTQQLQLETRKVQMFQHYVDQLSSTDIVNCRRDIHNWEWEDPEDFYHKYWYPNNPEEAEKLRKVFALYEKIGILLKEGVIDLAMMYDMLGSGPMREWERFESVIDYIRVNYEQGVKGMLFEYFEDMAYALMEYRDIDRKNFEQRYQRRKQTRAKHGKTIPIYNP